jgi:hypothetical protein
MIVTYIFGISWICVVLVDVQKLLAESVVCDVVSTDIRLYHSWNMGVSLPDTPSI